MNTIMHIIFSIGLCISCFAITSQNLGLKPEISLEKPKNSLFERFKQASKPLPPTAAPAKPFSTFRQSSAYKKFIQPQMHKTTFAHVFKNPMPPLPSEQDSSSSWTTRLRNAFSTFTSALKQKIQHPGGLISEIQREGKDYETLEQKEQNLDLARKRWHEIAQEKDIWWFVPHRNRTDKQEREFNAISTVLQIYDDISKERTLNSQETFEIVEAAKKLDVLAYESEKPQILQKKQSILKREPTSLKGKFAIAREEFKQINKEQKAKVFHEGLNKLVDTLNLVDVVKATVIENLKQYEKIPESHYNRLAEILILEAYEPQAKSSGAFGAALDRAGYSDVVREKAIATVEWYIQNIPETIAIYIAQLPEEKKKKIPVYVMKKFEKQVVPFISRQIEPLALPHASTITAQLMPIIAEKIKQERDAKASMK